MKCCNCGREITRDEALGEWCRECFDLQVSRVKPLTGQQREAAKRLAREEMEGLLPREALRGLIEEGYGRMVIKGSDFDEEVSRLINEIERLTGIAIIGEALRATGGMRGAIEEQEEELREKVRRLAELR